MGALVLSRGRGSGVLRLSWSIGCIKSSVSSSLRATPESRGFLNLEGIRFRGDGLPDVILNKNELSAGPFPNAFVNELSGETGLKKSSSTLAGVEGGLHSSKIDVLARDFPEGEPILGPKNNVAELATRSNPKRGRSSTLIFLTGDPASLLDVFEVDLW